MSEPGEPGGEPELRKAEDFVEALKTRTPDELRQELGLPDVDEILKDLQRKHGIRISPSRKLIERLEAIKVESGGYGELVPVSGCVSTDVCILCDHGDICSTCDTMDWCMTTAGDTHIVEAE